ncbi:aldo/keto reductase [Nitratireductor thuwali]|uniref:Oxidoreductase n=1 Tax=Nitratireductor thuwali TaxID=2267699 RepID=A0ABY5MLG7_9HYPH|nr:putative oxidoreductase [Nitratireductor thuwali]
MTPQTTIELRSGNAMPVLGLGTWQLTDHTAETIAKALELGYPMIDTSGDYGTQPGIGEGIERSGMARDAFFLVTKVEETDDAYQAVKDNLDQLKLDYADLMLIHRPPPQGPGTELWEGLMRARDEGLTRDIGVSNYSAGQIDALIEATQETPAVNQIEWSPFGHSDAMLRHAKAHRMVIQAYSPLTREKRLDDAVLKRVADSHGKTPAQVLIRWNLQLGTVPLPKANQEKHLHEDLDVFDFSLSDDEMNTLSQLNEHYSSLGRLPYI